MSRVRYKFEGTQGSWFRVDGQDFAEIKSDNPSAKVAIVAKPEDANLISAAPDLLEFAIMVFQSIDGGGRVVTFQDFHIDELREAIHKALNLS